MATLAPLQLSADTTISKEAGSSIAISVQNSTHLNGQKKEAPGNKNPMTSRQSSTKGLVTGSFAKISSNVSRASDYFGSICKKVENNILLLKVVVLSHALFGIVCAVLISLNSKNNAMKDNLSAVDLNFENEYNGLSNIWVFPTQSAINIALIIIFSLKKEPNQKSSLPSNPAYFYAFIMLTILTCVTLLINALYYVLLFNVESKIQIKLQNLKAKKEDITIRITEAQYKAIEKAFSPMYNFTLSYIVVQLVVVHILNSQLVIELKRQQQQLKEKREV